MQLVSNLFNSCVIGRSFCKGKNSKKKSKEKTIVLIARFLKSKINLKRKISLKVFLGKRGMSFQIKVSRNEKLNNIFSKD